MPQYDRLLLQPSQVKCAIPKPVQLGSLKSENDKGAGVQLVPAGGCGWGRPNDDKERGRMAKGTGVSLLRAKSEHPGSRPGEAPEQPKIPAQPKPTWNLAKVSSSSWHKTQQTLGLEREFPELGTTPPKAASWGSNTPTPQCLWPESSASNWRRAGESPASWLGPAHVRSSSERPAPTLPMGPEQVKASLEHKQQQQAMREKALKRQAEKEAEIAEQQREQFARAQEKLEMLEQRAKERRMKEKQEEKERRRRELEDRRRQESPHLRGWPVDHGSTNSRTATATVVAQRDGPVSPQSRGWFIGNTRSCPALTQPPAETPPPPPQPPPPRRISILQHEHRRAENVTCAADGGNQGEQHRQDLHEVHGGSDRARAEAAPAAMEPAVLLPSQQATQQGQRDGGRCWDGRLPQESLGSEAKSGADRYHQHQHNSSNHHRKGRQQHQQQVLLEGSEDKSVAEPPTSNWSAASYGGQQQQAWTSPPQTWQNSGHSDDVAWQQDVWEDRSIADEQVVHKRTEWSHWSRGGDWQQHRAEPDVQQHWEWSGSDWTQERQGQGKTYYGKQSPSDHYKSRIPPETQLHQDNGSLWRGNMMWQDLDYDHGTQAGGSQNSVRPVEGTAAAPEAAPVGAAAKAAASRSRIRVAAREARAALAAGAERGRQSAGETARRREELQAVESRSHRRLRAFSDDEATDDQSHSHLQVFRDDGAVPLCGDPVGDSPASAESRSRRRLRAFSDDEAPIHHVRRGLRAFRGACSSEEEATTTSSSRLGLQAFNAGASSSSRQALCATAIRSHRGLRAFSGSASSRSDGEEQPPGVVVEDGQGVSRGKLRAWVSGSRTPPSASGSGTNPVSVSCRDNTATAKEGRDFAAKLFRSVIHPKAAVGGGPHRQQLLHHGAGATVSIPASTPQATTEDFACTSEPSSTANGNAAAPNSGKPRIHGEQHCSAQGEHVEDGCNLVARTDNVSAESPVGDSTQKAAEGSSNAGGVRSYYVRRDTTTVGGVAINWLASVSRKTLQSSQPQTQHRQNQEQQQTMAPQQSEKAEEVAQDADALTTLDPSGDGIE